MFQHEQRGMRPRRSRAHIRRACLWLFGVLLALELAEASAAELKNELAAFLNLGWETSARSYEAATRQYLRLREDFPAEARIPYAMTVIAIKHRRYDTALARIDEMLAIKPNLWLGQRARLWLLVVLRQNEAALEQLVAAAETIAADPKLSAERRTERLHWLGRIYAYIAAPTGADVAPALLRRYEQRIMAALLPEGMELFDAGRESLLSAFAERKSDQQLVRAAEKEAQEREKSVRKDELATEKTETVAAADDVEAHAAALQKQLEADLGELDDAIAERQEQLAPIRQQASIVLATMDQLAVNINSVRLQIDATPPEDVYEMNRLLAILRSWQIDYDRQAAIYRPLAIEGQRLQNEIANLGAQRQRTIAVFDAEMRELGRTLTVLQRRSLRIEQDQRKLAKSVSTGNTAKVRAQDLVLSALTTYEPFPVEQEIQVILRSLK